MARARRGRVNLLGIDPSYTRHAEREGVSPELAAQEAAGVDAPASIDQGVPAQSRSGPPPAVRSGMAVTDLREVDADPTEAGPPAPPQPSKATAASMNRQVRIGLSHEVSAQLAALSRDQGVSVPVIAKALRARVVARFLCLLEAGERPTDQAVHRGGHAERVFIRLQGVSFAQARAWFDPMDLGEAAMADAMRPVLARLFEEELNRIARR